MHAEDGHTAEIGQLAARHAAEAKTHACGGVSAEGLELLLALVRQLRRALLLLRRRVRVRQRGADARERVKIIGPLEPIRSVEECVADGLGAAEHALVPLGHRVQRALRWQARRVLAILHEALMKPLRQRVLERALGGLRALKLHLLQAEDVGLGLLQFGE